MNYYAHLVRRVLIILGLEVLNTGTSVVSKIGNPVALTDSSVSAAKAAASAASARTESSSFGSKNRPSYASDASAAPSGGLLSGQLTHPISSLSPYQNKWVIKARVMSKGPMRTWSNQKGEGKLFSFDMMDESGEIRATAFKEQADKFYDMVEVDKVYYISRCQLKPANKQYSKLNNDYEMTFNSDTVMQECSAEDLVDVPKVKYEFVSIADLAGVEKDRAVDVVAVCRNVGELSRFTARSSGKELTKREVTLVDSSNAAVSVYRISIQRSAVYLIDLSPFRCISLLCRLI